MMDESTFFPGPPRRSYQKIRDFRHALLGQYYDNDDMMMAVSPSEIVEVERRMEPTTTMTPMTYGPSNKKQQQQQPSPAGKKGPFSPSDSTQNSAVFSGMKNPNQVTSNGFVPVQGEEIEAPQQQQQQQQQQHNGVYSSIPQLAFDVNDLTIKNYTSSSSHSSGEQMMPLAPPMLPTGTMQKDDDDLQKRGQEKDYFYYEYAETEDRDRDEETGENVVVGGEKSPTTTSTGEADFYAFEEYLEEKEVELNSYYYPEEYEDKDSLDDTGSQPLMFDLLVGADLSGKPSTGKRLFAPLCT